MRILILLFALQAAGGAAQTLDLRFTPVIDGVSQVTDITHAADGSGRLFLAERTGRIKIWNGVAINPTLFLELGDALPRPTVGEQGLLGVAFAPDYPSSGRFYVNYTTVGGNTRISRFRVSATNPDVADLDSEEVLLSIGQPFNNHNGGQLAFGPDGMLYIATGDGGASGDPFDFAQNRLSLLGKLLRIDVSPATGYAVPPDNPFVNDPEARPEIWALGLRNPWRFAFDEVTGDLYIADVGQDNFEEINLVPAGSGAGLNFGWRIFEGSLCFAGDCNTPGLTPPTFEYGQPGARAVIGGRVYRGSSYPRMQGLYFFADFVSGHLWGMRGDGSVTQYIGSASSPIAGVLSFGTDEVGNLYLSRSNQILLVSDGEPVVSGIPIGPGITGAWFDPAQSGHGIFLEVLDPSPNFPQPRLLAWWFTFDPDGNQAWFGGTGPIEGDRAIVDVVQTRGGRWIPNFDPTQIVNDAWGTLHFSFDSCSSGTVEFSSAVGGFGSGSMHLTRLTQPSGLTCP
jgi:glucose/arabinose dehydrogenase